MSPGRLIIPLVVLAAVIAGSVPIAAGSFPDGVRVSLALPAPSDTTAHKAGGQDWSPEEVKELLAEETGEPDIQGSTWKKRKNPRTAMLCALVFPGLGQVYNEKAFKAVIALGVETFYFMNVANNWRNADDWLKKRDGYERYVPCGEGTCLNPQWQKANAWYEEYKARTIDWVWWTSAAILVVMLDAYVDANLHDMRFRVETARTGGGTGLAVVVDF